MGFFEVFVTLAGARGKSWSAKIEGFLLVPPFSFHPMSSTKQSTLQAVKGMNDLLPDQSALWEWFEDTCRHIFRQYGYRAMRTPVVEPTPLFVRSIGEVTDIVEKEMYSFEDKLNGDPLTLRPEHTAGLLRAAIEHNLIYNGPQRVWTSGPVFRHEAPQAGRYRQFHQYDVEALGYAGPDVDAEQMVMLARLWKALDIPMPELQINTIGDTHERARYREALIKHFEAHFDALDDEGKRRLHTNPLRLLDSKAPSMQEVIAQAPQLMDYLDDPAEKPEGAKAHFERVKQLLTDAGVAFTVNTRLVRGLDYYNRTVFEFVSKSLKRSLTIAAGGRYDGLFEQLGGKPAPGIGFGIGVERVLLHFDEQQKTAPRQQALDCYVAFAGDGSDRYAFSVAEGLRSAGLSVALSHGGKFATQLKRADASGARFAIIAGDSELAAQTITIKNLRESTHDGAQQTLSLAQAIALISTQNNH
jgi:histidyl-tRNA synthetase